VLHFLLKRLLTSLVTLWIVITLTFFLIRVLPGGPFDEDRALPPAIMANLEAQYHLNDPPLVQYGRYLSDLLHGDLGPSFKYQSRRVNDIVAESFGVSLQIGALALILGLSLGVVLGVAAGMTPLPWVDTLLSLLGVSSLSTPSFIFGGLLVLVFALELNLLPAARLVSPIHYVLPVTTLALVPFAYSFLLVRTQIKEVKTRPFVLIKRAFGVKDKDVQWHHVWRNAGLPLLSILGPLTAALITGSFAVEYIFAIPGMGKHFINGVANRDYTLVMGLTLIYSVILLALNLATDLLYGWLDPRLRLTDASAEKG